MASERVRLVRNIFKWIGLVARTSKATSSVRLPQWVNLQAGDRFRTDTPKNIPGIHPVTSGAPLK